MSQDDTPDGAATDQPKDQPKDQPTDAASGPEPATRPAAGRVHAVVAAHIEPVTRFDGGVLSETEPEQAYGVPLELALAQTVAFEIQTRRGAARLSAGTDKLVGEVAVMGELGQRLSRAIDEAPEALRRWSRQEPGAYRRLMPAHAGFLRAPGSVGHEYTCTTCHGACQVACSACQGVGNTMCHGCHGAGRISCYRCHGSKRLSCSACSGRGSWTEQVATQTWNSSTNSYQTSYSSQYRSCSSCGASGQTTCHSCEYDGKIRCSGCFGKGRIDCGVCRATGKVDCSACLASGIQHLWGTIVAGVSHEEDLSVASDDEALVRLVRERVPLEDLPELGELLDVHHEVGGGATLCSRHRLRLDVRRAALQALGQDFVIHGLGPQPRVFSFENIAGHLLREDLEALEQAVAGASRWRRQAGSSLLDGTAAFLRSELNMLIAERVADLKASPQEAAEQVQRHFHGLVDSAYVERATTALRGALARLYGAELAEPAAYLCGITALLAGLLFGLGWPSGGPWMAAGLVLPVAALGWLVLEWQTRRRIGRRFEPEFARRVFAQLAANGSRRRWRIGVGLAAAAAVVGGIQATAQLPFVRSHHARQYEQANAAAVLAAWPALAQPDLRLRAYPGREMLQRHAEGGDTRAQLILAWQLLLGAGGAAKDVDAAGRWLQQAQPRASGDPLWKAAKAVHLLNQEAMPDAIRAAARELDAAADRGLVEARFWQARIYLEPHSPAFDARLGLQALTQAAERGHAHAALALGQRLAAGEGVRKDVNAARRHLMRAAGEGLPEAQEALDRLR